MRNSVGSNILSFNQPKQKEIMKVIKILINAIKNEQLDEENELKGIVLGVNKKDSLRRRWSESVLLKDGQDLDFKDQTIKDKWPHDIYIGHWR
jgi:NOL1/NOP2/fmu family ribosome biogenesis protein